MAKIQYFLSFNEVLTQKPRTKITGERVREKATERERVRENSEKEREREGEGEKER